MANALKLSSRKGKASVPISWLCLNHRSSPVCSCTGKPNSPEDAVPHGWLAYVVPMDRHPECLAFVPHFNSSGFSAAGFITQKPWFLGTAYNLQRGSAPFLSSFFFPFSSGFLYRILIFFLPFPLTPNCFQLIQEKVEVTGRVKTRNLIFLLSINHAWFQPAI